MFLVIGLEDFVNYGDTAKAIELLFQDIRRKAQQCQIQDRLFPQCIHNSSTIEQRRSKTVLSGFRVFTLTASRMIFAVNILSVGAT